MGDGEGERSWNKPLSLVVVVVVVVPRRRRWSSLTTLLPSVGERKGNRGQSLFVCFVCRLIVCLSTTSGFVLFVCANTNVEFEVVLDVSLIYTRSHPLHVRRGK